MPKIVKERLAFEGMAPALMDLVYTELHNLTNAYMRSLVLWEGQLIFKGSKTTHFIMKSYIYKSLMTPWVRFKTKKPSLQHQKKCFFLLCPIVCFP